MASTNNTFRCHDIFSPSACDMSMPKCKWGNIRPTPHNNPSPARNPVTAGIHAGVPLPSIISIAGANKDQKLTAIITRAAKPSIKINNF
jgi:hypothetical protein